MKKVLCILLSFVLLGTASFAQVKQTTGARPTPKGTPNNSAVNQGPAKANEPKPKASPANINTQSGQIRTKKDGTPDKRYKENKQTTAPAGKMKKDGTPDKRYKATQPGAAKKAN